MRNDVGSACSPGVEFIQLFSGWMALANYDKDKLDSIYNHYLETLHARCPQATEYTKEMLIEDFGERYFGAV